MKSVALFFGLMLLMALTNSCKKCNNEDPTARVVNNGTSAASLQLKASDGDIISITELPNGSISSVKSYAPGITIVSCTIDGIQLSESVNMSECISYDITINSENEIVVFSHDKN